MIIVLAENTWKFPVDDPWVWSGKTKRGRRHCYQLCYSLQINVKVAPVKVENWKLLQMNAALLEDWTLVVGNTVNVIKCKVVFKWLANHWPQPRNRSCDFISLCNLQSGNSDIKSEIIQNRLAAAMSLPLDLVWILKCMVTHAITPAHTNSIYT